MQALGYPEAQDVVVPFRDLPPGEWDGWPPIFTAQYAMYHGAVSYTVEIPLQVNNAAYDELPVEELRRRSAINTDVSEATMRTTLDYAGARTGSSWWTTRSRSSGAARPARSSGSSRTGSCRASGRRTGSPRSSRVRT